MKVLLVTKNQGKAIEMKKIMSDMDLELMDLTDLDIDIDVIEDGKTFEENALKKAYTYHKATGLPCIADDSGLEVDYLKGAPGVYTARYAGDSATDQENIMKLLREMESAPEDQRNARFVCAIAFVLADGTAIITRGVCDGKIAHEMRGSNGFGYDPVFYVPEYNMTFAELDDMVKNRISHRAKALEQMKKYIKKLDVML
ncbi:XTP/dITP diphosphatase [Caldanaerobius fijiensis]|nr:XTP/dITP diphosphatase [Caldanaerobius fijiensis]